MHSLVALVAILVSFVAFTNPALARRVTIGGTHSIGELRAKCTAAGGMSFSKSDGSYSCLAKGLVQCNAKGKCYGEVPRRQVPNGGRTGAVGGTTKAMSFGATRIGGTQATHGAPPRSAVTLRPCARHHC
jgi:hypothetical protein